MFMLNWLGQRKSKHRSTVKPRMPRRRFQPIFESLEARTVPTVALAMNESQFFARNAWDYLGDTFNGAPEKETAGQLPFTLVDTDPSKFVFQQAGTASPLTPDPITGEGPQTLVSSLSSTSGFSVGEFVEVTDGATAPLFSIIDNVSSGSIQLDDAWHGNSAVTVSVLDPLSSPSLTLCWDLQNFLSDRFDSSPDPDTNIFRVLPILPTGAGAPANAGQIAYLFDQYGTFDITNAALDNAALSHAHVAPPGQPTGTPAEAVGLQVAVWELEYGSAFQGLTVLQVAPGNPNSTSAELNAINAWVSFYIGDSTSQSQGATFLQANGSLQSFQMGVGGTGAPSGQQGMMVTPMITTSQQPTTATVGTPVADKATVTGGFLPTGTVTFKLYNNPNATGTPLFTDTESLVGGMATSTGYTTTATGTDYWVATYNGDSNNTPVTSPATSEPLTITPGGPGITTTPSSTTTTVSGGGQFATIGFWHNKNGQAAINNFDSGPSSTMLGNALASGYPHLFGSASSYLSSSLAGQTNAQVAADYLNLWTPSGLTKNTYVQAFAVAFGLYAGGNAGSFNVGSNGTALGVTNNSTLPVTQILQIADANFNPSTGLFFGGDQTKTSALNNVLDGINSTDTFGSSTVVTSSTKLQDSATLSGGSHPTGTITFYLFAPGVTPNGNNSNNVYSDVVTINGDGTYTTASGTNPGGYTPAATGTYQWVAVYGGDSNNNGVTSPFGSEPFTVGQSTPTFFTTPGGSVVIGSGAKLSDSATLADGTNPTGTITFYLFAPGVTPNSNNSNNVYSDTVTVSGNGTYSTSTGSNAGGYLPTVTGTYQWVAIYSGDTDNSGATGSFGDEPENVTPAGPSITTTPSPTTVTLGSSSVIVKDTAVLSGGTNPTGTITFTLYSPSNTLLDTETVTVSGNGSYTTPHGYTLTSSSATGTYQWDASYSGDSKNQPASDINDSKEQVVVSVASTPLGRGATATIGYWHNKNGQGLINSFNGGSTSKLLGNWLASNFPNLFGSFAGQTNAQVAADFLTAFGNVGGVQGNTYAQTFAVALAIYATDPTLGGGSAATQQGFTVKAGGTGSETYNVGSNGAAFGVANNTTLTVFQVMQILNSNYNPTTQLFYGGSQNLTSAANNVTNGINQGGDIGLAAAGTDAAGYANTTAALFSPGSTLMTGTLYVAVDGLQGDQAAYELARIDDAIASINNDLGSLGVNLVEVDNSDGTAYGDIYVHVASTTDIGGVDQGVLGVTEMGHEITIVSGWNFYLGNDPTAVGPDQYDFQTVVTHELGHSLGLGHSTDTASVMYPTLATGQARRDLTANDLSNIEQALETAPEPLMAAAGPVRFASATASIPVTWIVPPGAQHLAAPASGSVDFGAILAPTPNGNFVSAAGSSFFVAPGVDSGHVSSQGRLAWAALSDEPGDGSLFVEDSDAQILSRSLGTVTPASTAVDAIFSQGRGLDGRSVAETGVKQQDKSVESGAETSPLTAATVEFESAADFFGEWLAGDVADEG